MQDEVVHELARRLDERANERTRAWWTRYLKGAVAFRGVPMAGVREVVHALWSELGLDNRPRDEQLDVVLALFAQPYAEDKLAAILVLGERLIDDLTAADVPFLAEPSHAATSPTGARATGIASKCWRASSNGHPTPARRRRRSRRGDRLRPCGSGAPPPFPSSRSRATAMRVCGT
jgi:hypothetical protein